MKREDFLTIEVVDGIATLWLDHQLESQNIVSPDVIPVLDHVFADLEENPDVSAMVIISKKDNFIAGADIKAFAIEKEGDFRPFQKQGHEALSRLANGKKPVVAAIHGACMGLGTELALACHARIASDDTTTRMALPEVRLGLIPGGGGTQRLPRTIGIQRALDLMLTGRNVYAYQAKKIGLVDDVTNKSKLHHAARTTAIRLCNGSKIPRPKQTLFSRLLEGNRLGRALLFQQARKRAFKQSQGNYPAVPAILDCVETGYKKGEEAGYAKELAYFEKLMLTSESAAMRALFFAMSENKKNPFEVIKKEIDRIGVIGAGFMGAGIAEISVHAGMDVTLKDIKDEMLAGARRQIWNGLKKKLKYRSIMPIQAEEIIGRVEGVLSYTNFDQVDLVIEAVLEKMSLKKQIIDDIQTYGKDDVIIASNTSSLSVTEMAKYAANPERVVGMHYFSPVPKMQLLEIVRTEFASDEALSACYDVGVRQGKICIVVDDSPGFYVNRILAPYMNEALLMMDEGIGMVAIDKAMQSLGFPVGPIRLFDQVGLDIAAHVVQSSKKIFEGRAGFKISDKVVKMYEAGRLGKKNKKGFYQYHPKTGKRVSPDESAYTFFNGNGRVSLPKRLVQDRLLMLMLNEAVLCLEAGIIKNPNDGDLGAVFGIGFLPFTGGPFRYIDHVGAPQIVETMTMLAQTYGPQYRPVSLLQEKADKNGRFYSDHVPLH